MVRKTLLVIALAVLGFLLIGCQTVAGIGGDIKWSAEKTAGMLEGR